MTVALLQACSDVIDVDGGTGEVPFEKSMVVFSAGNAENTITRASIPYMERDGRFVCKMYYHSKTGDTKDDPYDVALPEDHGTQVTAWLKVNNTVGNCIYWNNKYTDVATDKQNEYGEKGAQAFYWQNRLPHAFLAVADFNQLKSNKASTGLTMPLNDYVKEVTTNDTQPIYTPYKYIFDDGTEFESYSALVAYMSSIVGETYQLQHTLGTGYTSPELAADGNYYSLSMWLPYYYDINDYDKYFLYQIKNRVTVEKVKVKYYAKQYDLTEDDNTTGMSMSKQPDPIQALTVKTPEGATQEANRVKLIFKHQFSQIQVNIKNSSDENDIPVANDAIKAVELLGVTRKGYVYVNLNDDGTVHPTDFEQVNNKTIPEADWKEPYGTEFKMFNRTDKLTETETELGYFKSYEAIAFGRLEGIRIKWEESEYYTQAEIDAAFAIINAEGYVQGSDPEAETIAQKTAGDIKPSTNPVVHNVIFQIPDDNLKNLQSGIRYIYNLELRRGTLALIRTVIKDWAVDETDYTSNGTINN